jgi:hypothetical protein
VAAVDDVLAHQAEPFRQFAEHAIGGELQIFLVVMHENS